MDEEYSLGLTYTRSPAQIPLPASPEPKSEPEPQTPANQTSPPEHIPATPGAPPRQPADRSLPANAQQQFEETPCPTQTPAHQPWNAEADAQPGSFGAPLERCPDAGLNGCVRWLEPQLRALRTQRDQTSHANGRPATPGAPARRLAGNLDRDAEQELQLEPLRRYDDPESLEVRAEAWLPRGNVQGWTESGLFEGIEGEEEERRVRSAPLPMLPVEQFGNAKERGLEGWPLRRWSGGKPDLKAAERAARRDWARRRNNGFSEGVGRRAFELERAPQGQWERRVMMGGAILPPRPSNGRFTEEIEMDELRRESITSQPRMPVDRAMGLTNGTADVKASRGHRDGRESKPSFGRRSKLSPKTRSMQASGNAPEENDGPERARIGRLCSLARKVKEFAKNVTTRPATKLAEKFGK
ncbi:MAG: hypothetical protein Q9227_002079 [Pyrenula ochraceoflavens]